MPFAPRMVAMGREREKAETGVFESIRARRNTPAERERQKGRSERAKRVFLSELFSDKEIWRTLCNENHKLICFLGQHSWLLEKPLCSHLP
jgi:hypothetical protein